MNAARREVLATAGRALLWLPLCLALWYVAAGAIGWLPARIAAPFVGAAAGKVTKVDVGQRSVTFEVEVEGPYRPGGSPRAEAAVEVPVATYTFGVGIYAALALAARAWRQHARVAIGFAILLPLPAFGIAFDALRQLGAAPQLSALLAWGGGTREAIALGYQVGSLLLPTLAPIVTWLALFPAAWRGPNRTPSPVARRSGA
jgi:hypothetical protein